MKAKDTINSRIKQLSYITIDDFIRIALSECYDSYYVSKEPIGQKNDFITGPEISQMFGEILGLWVVMKWMDMGLPKKLNLIELGPGTGSLIKNLLNITQHIRGFHDALDIHLIEINPKLRLAQKKVLEITKMNATFANRLFTIPNNPTIVIGNEFFDSLPIKQYIKINNIWQERVVILNSKEKLVFSSVNIEKLELLKRLDKYKFANNNAVVEFSEESEIYINLLQNILKHNKINCLFIDYGYNVKPGTRSSNHYNSTIQGISKHQYCDILHDIGNVDITSHVDFYMLSYFATQAGFKTRPIISQKEFLINYGIKKRLVFLSKDKDDNLQKILFNQYKRLIDNKQMGSLFKVLEIYN